MNTLLISYVSKIIHKSSDRNLVYFFLFSTIERRYVDFDNIQNNNHKKIKSQAPKNQQPQLLTVDVILFWKIVVVGSTIQGFMVIYYVSFYFVWRNETTFHFSLAINTYIFPRTNVQIIQMFIHAMDFF